MSPFYCPPPLGHLLQASRLRTPIVQRLRQGFAPQPLSIRLDIYNTYSHPQGVFIKGRALEKKSTDVPLEIADSWWMNLKRTWHALESDEVTDLELLITFQGKDYTVRTDDEGLFALEITPDPPLLPGVYPVTACLPQKAFHHAQPSTAQVFVLPTQQPSLGVISDIDDTILHTQVSRRVQMLKALLFSNGLTAKAIPGMAAIYQDLQQEGFGFHYLSGSPINLHQRLRSFIKHQGFPEGSMDLRHWGIGPGTDAILSSSTYKLQRLQKLFQRFPQRQFLLIGDSGEKDPEIYATVRKTFPRQVLGIAIHNVNHASSEDSRFKKMTLFADSQELEHYVTSIKASLPSLQKAPGDPSPNLSA
jgi:phosphatidate phosphatase APP1